MSTATYGVEAIWEGQKWLLDGFYRLTVAIGRTVAGTFSTANRIPKWFSAASDQGRLVRDGQRIEQTPVPYLVDYQKTRHIQFRHIP
jgi:hypothetical protein